MTFRHIVLQNLRYNFKRFLSYLFVNSFVVAVLFMYGSLLLNEILAKDAAMQMVSPFIEVAAFAIILFSIVFVAYTGIYFVMSRGREFSVYLTLGMTTRDLIRMIVIESLVIVIGSVTCGIVAGLLLSKLFYLVLGKILGLTTNIYFIDYKTFLLSLGVFLIVFLCNLLFTALFVRKLSIIQISKASQTKGVSKSRPVIGGISIIVFAFSMWFFHAGLTGNDLLEGLLASHGSLTWMIAMLTLAVSLYFAIACCMDVVRVVFARFPKLYNRNILILSNLSHRFYTYKVSLYVVSVLIALALFFSGFGLSMYSFTKKTIDEYIPYDFMIETSGDINAVSADEVKRIVEASGGTLGTFSSFEFIRNEDYRKSPGRFAHYSIDSMIISETNFNKHMGLSVDVAPDELLLVYNDKGAADKPIDYDSIITIEPWRAGVERAKAFRSAPPPDVESFMQSLGDTPRLTYEQSRTRSMYATFMNSYANIEFDGVLANIVDDTVYEGLRQAERNTVYLFDLQNGNGQQVFAGILDALRAHNNADSSLWAKADSQADSKDQAEHLRPIYKAERYEVAFRIGGFMLFAFAFLGLLFLLSSVIVLYYKIVTSIDEEKEKIALLQKIGLLGSECRSYLHKHLAILFFAPLVIGGVVGLFLVYLTLTFTVYAGYLMGQVGMMYGLFVLINILFYLSLRKKFIREVGLLRAQG